MSILAWVLCSATSAVAEEPAAAPAAAPDPKTVPITTAVTPTEPGPFKARVDPYIVATAGGTTQLTVKLTVPPKTKLYRDQVGVEVVNAAGLVPGAVAMPPGTPYEDPYFGATREVYAADTVLLVPITVPAATRKRVDLTVTVSWQGCSDSMCFMPSGQTFNVPVHVTRER